MRAKLKAHISNLFNWAQQNGFCPPGCNPAQAVRVTGDNPPPNRVAFMREEAEQFLELIHRPNAACPQTEAFRPSENLQIFLAIAFSTGFRPETVTKLRWKHVDLQEGLFKLPGEVTKNRKPVVLPMSEPLRLYLRSVLQRKGFVKPEDRMVSARTDSLGHRFRKYLSRFLEDLRQKGRADRAEKLQGATLRSARYSFASWLAETEPMPVVSALLGHSKRQGTGTFVAERYTQVPLQRLREAVEKVAVRLPLLTTPWGKGEKSLQDG